MKRFKYLIRKFKYSRKRTYTLGVLFLVLFGLGIGYAFVNTTLNITGALGVASSKWDVHFENIEINDESVEAETDPTITDNTTISFSATLEDPGDMYEYTVDVVNDGTYDAKIDSFTITPTLTSEQQEYFEYEVKYTEGGNIQVGDALDAGATENIKVYIKYKENEDSSKYPGEDTEFNFSLNLNYIQGKGNEVIHPTLYNVLKTAAKEGTYAKKYTGEHQDSMAGVGNKDIYHWYGSSDTNGTAILDKNNVIFANHCWQMIRTTDTGGVKMIYNGEVENNQCLNTRGAHVGYTQRISQNLASNYWYGTDYTYDSTNQVFSIAGTTEQTTWSEANASGLIGKYTCKNTSADGSCSTLYLVESYYNTSSAYVIPLNSNSNYWKFGQMQFNANNNSISYAGYMYNTVYQHQSKTMTAMETILSGTLLGTNYWYANSAIWDTPTVNRYNLDNPYQVSGTDDYPNLVGKYTFNDATQTYTGTSVYYIAAVSDSTMYYIQLGNETGSTHDLNYYNYTYTYGDSYRDNGNGTYTITNQDESNPTTIYRSDWYSNYNNVKNKYVCKNAINDTCSELWYTTETSNTYMTYISSANSYKYAKSFEYKLDSDDNTYKYFLDNTTSTTFWNTNDSTNQTSINNHHYTCWNTTGKCTNISYIYYLGGINPRYINITNGKSIEDAVNEMLYNNDVNTKNSIIKSGIDAWYKHYLLEDYDNYIEDTIFCNNRSIKKISGWNPDGGSVTTYLQFNEVDDGTSNLSCTNTTDKFSVSNTSAQLSYKIGLMSKPEMKILNNNNVRKTGASYWLISPTSLSNTAINGHYVRSEGNIDSILVSYNVGVRPAISLKPGTEYSSGDGSMANPYIIE